MGLSGKFFFVYLAVAGGAANDMEKKAKANKGKHNLRIIEIEFLESIKE